MILESGFVKLPVNELNPLMMAIQEATVQLWFLGVLHFAKMFDAAKTLGWLEAFVQSTSSKHSGGPESSARYQFYQFRPFSCFAFSCQGPVVVSVDGEPWSNYEYGVFDGCRRHPETMTEPRHSRTFQDIPRQSKLKAISDIPVI